MKASRGVLLLLPLLLASGCTCCQGGDCGSMDGGMSDNNDNQPGPEAGIPIDAGPDAGPAPKCDANGDPQASMFCTLTDTAPLPQGLADPAAVVQDGYVYVIGGDTDTMGVNTTSAIHYAAIDPSSGALQSWTVSDTGLPTALGETAAVANNGFIYVLGGVNSPSSGGTPAGNPVSTVSIFQVNPDGGTLTAVDAGTNALPEGLEGGAATVLNGFIYYLGGESQSELVKSPDAYPTGPVYFAPINSDGSLGDWMPTTVLPGGRWHFGAVAANGWVYAIGGQYPNSDNYCQANKIYQAQQNSDGSLGNWLHPANEFQIDLNFATAALVNNLLVVAGGVTHYDTCQMGNTFWLAAEVSSTGEIGAWEEIAQYATAANERTIVGGPDAIYSFGGNSVGNCESPEPTLNTDTEHLVVQPSGAWDCP